MEDQARISVIDLFAGAGGLGEGFSAYSCDGGHRFDVALSIEKDKWAHLSLLLRSFFRQFPEGKAPSAYYDFLENGASAPQNVAELKACLQADSPDLEEQWERAVTSVGSEPLELPDSTWKAEARGERRQEINQFVEDARQSSDGPLVLIGGPPCQAYSVVGRARRLGNPDFVNRAKADAFMKINGIGRVKAESIIEERRNGVFADEDDLERVDGISEATIERIKEHVDELAADRKARFESDPKHTLYHEYLSILHEARPDVFVVETVKGVLSATLKDEPIFPRICTELENPGKSLGLPEHDEFWVLPFVRPGRLLFDEFRPSDFVVRCEDYGVPQQRHRVFLLGVKKPKDLEKTFEGLIESIDWLTKKPSSTVADVIDGLPELRSGLSRRRLVGGGYQQLDDSGWLDVLERQCPESDTPEWLQKVDESVRKEVTDAVRCLRNFQERSEFQERGGRFIPWLNGVPEHDTELSSWLYDDRLGGWCQHQTRGHLESDLPRYLFAACYARANDTSPELDEFVEELAPDHDNRSSGKFKDRFRVQLRGSPASTITAHISKDGHYYIHHDPRQCRSLTVREAARLQTFPDNYFFCGEQTHQYVQIGNAVPPFLAQQIAEVVYQVLEWLGRTAPS